MLQIIPIPAFQDNYIWLIHNGKNAIVVDPGDASPVLHTLTRLKLQLQTILVTHHHHDHIGGIPDLIQHDPRTTVYAPRLESYPFPHQAVSEPDLIHLTDFPLQLSVLDVPGHTLGHIAYYAKSAETHHLFCGDTLFGAGCGRLFEGTAMQMFASLQKLSALPDSTHIYCAHEYTLRNLNFARTLEPNNTALLTRQQATQQLQGRPSLPSTLALELATNPFLRCHSQEIRQTLQLNQATDLQVFSAVRLLRNHF